MTMTAPLWQNAVQYTIPAQPRYGFWTRVIDFVEPGTWLKFAVEDVDSRPPRWSYAPDHQCTADGDPTGPLNAATCLVPLASPGALIAKVGGSCAGKSDGGISVVVGSFCQILLNNETHGTLYLTMNFDPLRPAERKGELRVNVSVST